MEKKKFTVDAGEKILIGISGEYFVAGELTRQGYIASLTLKNTKGVDILVTNKGSTKIALIQVKTTTQNDWLLGKKAEGWIGMNLYYVFVKLDSEGRQIRYYVVPSKEVANYVTKSHRKWLKTPGRKDKKHKDNSIRIFKIEKNEEKYLDKWSNLNSG